MTKPFGMRDLNARLRVALRHHQAPDDPGERLGPGYGKELHYLKVYAYRIRRKLHDESGHLLQSDPSVGYRLAPPGA
jgi:DNA-binding response OmpR family regulator